MSSIRLTKSQAIERMNQLANEAVEIAVKQKDVVDSYNKLLKEHFGMVEDGKTMTKLDVINLVDQLLKMPRIS